MIGSARCKIRRVDSSRGLYRDSVDFPAFDRAARTKRLTRDNVKEIAER